MEMIATDLFQLKRTKWSTRCWTIGNSTIAEIALYILLPTDYRVHSPSVVQEQQDNNQSNERLILMKHGHFVHKSIKVLKSIRVVVIVQAGSCVVQAPGTTKATVRTKDSIYDYVNVKSVLLHKKDHISVRFIAGYADFVVRSAILSFCLRYLDKTTTVTALLCKLWYHSVTMLVQVIFIQCSFLLPWC